MISLAKENSAAAGVWSATDHQFLGNIIGNFFESLQYMKSMVHFWVSCINHFAKVAVPDPQAACVCSTISFCTISVVLSI